MLTHSLNDEIASVTKQTEDLTDTKQEVLVSHIPMHFEDLRSTKGIGKIFFKVWVDLETLVVKIEFCGITQQKDVANTSTGKGIYMWNSRWRENITRDFVAPNLTSILCIYSKHKEMSPIGP